MYDFERLSDDISLAVSEEHTFGTDALLLADFSAPKPSDTAMDMGTGCGIIPFLWLRDGRIKNVHCLDIQPNAVEQVQCSIEKNGVQSRLEAYLCDIREIEKHFAAGGFSLVTMNPPYKPLNTGIESLDESARIARHEICCNIEDAVRAGAYLLKCGGRLCICHRPERLVDCLCIMRRYSVEPKRLRFVADSEGKEPFLFLIEGRKGSKPFLKILPTLAIRGKNGKFTEEMLGIYGSYADGYDK